MIVTAATMAMTSVPTLPLPGSRSDARMRSDSNATSSTAGGDSNFNRPPPLRGKLTHRTFCETQDLRELRERDVDAARATLPARTIDPVPRGSAAGEKKGAEREQRARESGNGGMVGTNGQDGRVPAPRSGSRAWESSRSSTVRCHTQCEPLDGARQRGAEIRARRCKPWRQLRSVLMNPG